MEDLDRLPAAQRQETRADRIMVSDLDLTSATARCATF